MKTPASLLVGFALAGLVSSAPAAVLVIDNASFEQPAVGKIADFRDSRIPGWEGVLNGGSADSGLETSSLVNRSGTYVGFIQPQSNFTAYNYFSGGYVAAAGDQITLNFVAAPSQNTPVAFTLSLVWDDPGVAGAADVIQSQSLNTSATSGTLASVSASFTLDNSGAYLGQPIGFALTNNNTGSVWLMVDNFSGSVVSAVPEPSSYAALSGLAALGAIALRRRPRR